MIDLERYLDVYFSKGKKKKRKTEKRKRKKERNNIDDSLFGSCQ